MNFKSTDILKKLPGVQENVPLANYTTFKIGGPARYFFIAKTKEDITKAIKAAKKYNLPIFVLGGGSNLLVSDRGFEGLVIKVQSSKLKVKNYNAKFKIIETDSGVPLSKVITESIQNELTGLEWAMGIPGTVGGAVVGNAGAYGQSISESIESVTAMSPVDFFIKKYTKQDCQFDYRDSIFKKKDEIILEVTLKLEKGDREKSQQIIKKIISERKGKIPPLPSAGSIFKNIKITDLTYIEIPRDKIKNGMIATGYLIEQCGLKGRQIGQAKIADEHANFIVNIGSPRRSSGEAGEAGTAKAEDVIALIKLCKEKVREKFGIDLEEEIRYLGF